VYGARHAPARHKLRVCGIHDCIKAFLPSDISSYNLDR
jgi:hypothetical protein